MGWEPGLNDSVRLNICPFMTADILQIRAERQVEQGLQQEPRRQQPPR